MKQRFHRTSMFSARLFVCQFYHDETKKKYTGTTLLLLQENEYIENIFKDQNHKRNKLHKPFRKRKYFPSSSLETTYIHLHLI